MNRKEFLKIINEEITQFDFLNNDNYLKEQQTYEMLNNESFQKQFIVDSITNMRDKIKIDTSDSHVTNDPEINVEDYHNDMSIDSNVEVTYQSNPNAQPIKFVLSFSGNRIGYYTGGQSEPETGYGSSWYDRIEWGSIAVNLYTDEGDEIKFIALEKAPDKIYELFVRSYMEDVIEKYTDVGEVKERLPQYTPF